MQFQALTLLSIFCISKACTCGQSQPGRIIGGSVTKDGEFPWMASIVSAEDKTFSRCGATIVAAQYALTAFHCVSDQNPSDDRLLVGGYNLDSPDYGSQYMKIRKYILYKPGRNHNKDDDIAVIVLSDTILYSRIIQPICLPTYPENFAGVQATVLGYGYTDSKETIDTKVPLSARISVTSNANCNQILNLIDVPPISEATLCAGSYHTNKDACSGDSGGPLMYYDTQYSRWKLIGIVSSGFGCGYKSSYGFYTNVSHFSDWIQQNIGYTGCVFSS